MFNREYLEGYDDGYEEGREDQKEVEFTDQYGAKFRFFVFLSFLHGVALTFWVMQ